MRTSFRRCLLVNFAVDPSALRSHLPPHLEPDVFRARAYVSIVIADMLRMRPEFLPSALGVTYTQVVYRAVVRCGRERGVTFLRSDANSKLMVKLGNALTFFRFNNAAISWRWGADGLEFSLEPNDRSKAGILAKFNLQVADSAQMPRTSRFNNMESASAFLTELYTAFGAKRADGRVEVVRLARGPWRSKVAEDRAGVYEAMQSGLLFSRSQAELDSVFVAVNVPYRWNRLALERPTP